MSNPKDFVKSTLGTANISGTKMIDLVKNNFSYRCLNLFKILRSSENIY
jgi:hypothetical protein